MDFYVIPPLSNLELMNKGDRYFCLAQLFIKDQNYREFFKQKVAEGKWVTLDNGAGDHDLVTHRSLMNVMHDLKPSEIIPPDVLFDGIATIRNLELFIKSMKDVDTLGKIKVLGCPQGNVVEHWMFVYEYMMRHPHVDAIGLSKIAVPKAFMDASRDMLIKEARHYCYDILKGRGWITKPIHLLGMGDPTEFQYYKSDPLMRSTDSCNTVWSGMNHIAFADNDFRRVPTPKDYFERQMTPIQMSNAEDNIEWFKEQLK